MRIWIDPDKPTEAGWKHVDNAWSAIYYLSEGLVESFSIAYDFGNEELYGSGKTVLEWLLNEIENDPRFQIPEIIIHDTNPFGYIVLNNLLETITRVFNELSCSSASVLNQSL